MRWPDPIRRFLPKRAEPPKDAPPNRAAFRAMGLQGATGAVYLPTKRKATANVARSGGEEPDGRWMGRRRGGFLGRRPAISYTTAARRRQANRMGRVLKGLPVRFRAATRRKRAAQRAGA